MKAQVRYCVLVLLALLLSLLAVPPAAGQSPTSTAEELEPSGVAAVSYYAVSLPGVRPSPPLDLSGYIQVPYSAALNPSGGQITIEAWVKRNASGRHETILGNGWQTSYWLGFSPSGKLRFMPHGSDSGVDGVATVTAGEWTHIAVTYDGTIRRYYINGVLDLVSAQNPGPLTPAPDGQALGIGFDVNDTFTPNYFGGWMDNLRIWRKVRNADDIRATMFLSFGTPQPGLLAEWHFNGNANDPVGGHNGTVRGQVTWGNEGAIPHDIRIPWMNVTPALDGFCRTDTEYASATQVTVDGAGVWLMHTASDMWVCFDGLAAGQSSARVYLDAQYTRLDPAQPEHLQLRVNSDGTLSAFEGTGTGGYTPTTAADGKWAGKFLECCGEFPTRRAEFRININLLGGWWGHMIGMALGKSIFISPRTFVDLWPVLAVSDRPSTWSRVTLSGAGTTRTFTGQVVYQPRTPGAAAVGVGGVEVKLIGSDPGGSEAVVATTQSSANGNFTLSGTDGYMRHRLELGLPPKGYLARAATANPPGAAVDARTVDYGVAGAGTYAGNVFTLGDALPYPLDTLHGPYFLIIAPQQIIDADALDEFVDFKLRQGFAVEVISVETINASFSGSNLPDKIRALEKARRADLGTRFQYVMLVGPHSVIPYVYFAAWFRGRDGQGNPDLTACLAPAPDNVDANAKGLKIKFSDWYYADLVSNFDSNGNGCLLDGIAADPNDPEQLPFPPGYMPDTTPTFQATVAVGRIPFKTADAVRRALANSMGFEKQAQSFKLRTLHAMSNIFLQGQSWAPKDVPAPGGSYHPCPYTGANKNCKHYTSDAAYVSEYARTAFLNAGGYLSTVFYESTKPPDASPVVSPQPLTGQNVLDELGARDYGLVNVAGHGGYDGVGRTYWQNLNQNSMVDSPTEPLPFNSVDEIWGAGLLDTTSLGQLTPDNGHGAVYVIAACGTGAPVVEDNFGATLLEDGHGIAWVGGLSMLGAGWWKQPSHGGSFSMQYYVAEKLLKGHLRLGDAVWQTLAYLTNNLGDRSAGLATGLNGDPTLSYWGNPGGQSTLAAWPMLRYDARGQSFTPLAGPEVPKKLWEYLAAAPDTSTLLPSPVVSNNGEVIVAHGTYVDVLRQGALYQRLNLDAAAFGTPAIAADGTIYALDGSGKLYAFPYPDHFVFKQPPQRYRRWVLSLGGTPRTSPIVGADGFIAVGIIGKVVLVRPDGAKFQEYSVPGNPIGALATDANRAVYVATTTGYTGRLHFFCDTPPCVTGQTSAVANSTPPLLAYGFVYVGRANGDVVKLTRGGLEQQAVFHADSAITAGPVAGPAGQVLVGTQNGTLYSLTQDLALRWQRNLGAAVTSVPAFSADALYIFSNNTLRAYSPYSGAPLWSRTVTSVVQDGSVAVGYGRELYVQTRGGRVYGFGEGWTYAAFAIDALRVAVRPRLKGFRVEWLLTAPASGEMSEAQGESAPQAAVGILLQRSADGGPWEDVAVLPAGTSVYTDTGVLENTSYAYRVQVLDSAGNDSDYTATAASGRSLPPLPPPPTLQGVTAVSADTLALEWSSPAGDVVTEYRIERSGSAGGPFEVALQTGGGITTTHDTGLAPGTTYYYRVVAINGTGASGPSAVRSGTTRRLALPAPQNVAATLLADGRVEINWTAGPVGAATAIEFTEGGVDGYRPLAMVGAAGPYRHAPGEPNTYVYRLKFVQGDAESEYTETGVVVIGVRERAHLYLPLVLRSR